MAKFKIQFKNLPKSFDLKVLENILFEKRETICVYPSPFSEYKFCYVPYSDKILIRNSLVFLTSGCYDYMILDGYSDIYDVYKLLQVFKSSEND